jgi:hypothetical protein
MSALEALRARAFHHAPPAEANQAIDEVRVQLEEASGAPAFSYELFAPRLDVDTHFGHHALPRLANFLHCRGFRSASTPGVFVSLFSDAGLDFIHGGDALEVLAALRGLTIDEVFRRYGDGGTGDPKLLGT